MVHSNSYIEIAHFDTQECALGYRSQYGNVVKTVMTSCLMQCSEYCLGEPDCKLFNWLQTTSTCELRNYNGYIFETQLCNLSLIQDTGAVAFFDVRF